MRALLEDAAALACHIPIAATSSNPTMASVRKSAGFPNEKNEATATSAVPVGAGDKEPKPAGHQPNRYAAANDLHDSVKGTN